MNKPKKVDNFSILIVAKYLQSPQDYINLVCVCKNYKKTLKKFRYNPIPVHNTNLFPLMQTQYIYNPSDKWIDDVDLYKICFPIPYNKYLEYQKAGNVKCSNVFYSEEDRIDLNVPFPEVIRSLGESSFRDVALKSIIIPTTITSLGVGCFQENQSLQSIEITSNIQYIPTFCFMGCLALSEIILPSTITAISDAAFALCFSLESLDIPDSVKIIEAQAFSHCNQLSSIHLPSSLISIPFRLFKLCRNLTTIEIPQKVSSVFDNAFEDCSQLTSLHLPQSIQFVGSGAFKNCSKLKEVFIPQTCDYMGTEIFDNCTQLTKLSLPVNPLGYISDEVSFKDSLFLKRFVKGYMRIEWRNEDIENTNRSHISKRIGSIPKQCNYIGDNCFEDEEFTDFCIPYTVRHLKDECFMNCLCLKNIYMPNSITRIRDGCFKSNKSVTHVHISKNLIILPEETFKDCEKLQSIIIPSKISVIEKNCFSGCKSLISIQLPEKCHIKKGCFNNCHSLKHINLQVENGEMVYIPSVNEYEILRTLGYKSSKCYFSPSSENKDIPKVDYPLHLKQQLLQPYSSSSIEIPTCVTSIGKRYFANNTSLKSIIIPTSVKEIHERCFANCSSLTYISIPTSVTFFGNEIFENADEIKQIDIKNNIFPGFVSVRKAFQLKGIDIQCPNHLMTIDDWKQYRMILPSVQSIEKFQQTISISEMVLPTTVKRIESKTFYFCSSLSRVVIPSSVTYIGKNCFGQDDLLEYLELNAQVTELTADIFSFNKFDHITIPSTVKVIRNNAFTGCRHLKSITIPSTVSRIEFQCFDGCTTLSQIIFDENCSISDLTNTFFNCGSLKEITLPLSVTSLEDSVFSDCSHISSVTIPNLKYMGINSFKCCFDLEHITLPSTLTFINSYSFEYCIKLKECHIPESVIKLGNNIFNHCSSLTSVTLPKNIQKVDKRMFLNCPNLKEVYLGEERITTYPFKVTYSIMKQFKSIGILCSNVVLTQEDLEESFIYDEYERDKVMKDIHYIERNCFRGISNLHEITIPSNVKEIGDFAFYNCSDLKTITFTSDSITIGNQAIPSSVKQLKNKTGILSSFF